jgi:hypothetical protein
VPFLIPTDPVVTVSGTVPVVSTGGSTPVISIQDTTTEQKGAVQLEDSISSDSVTKAATPKNVKEVYNYATTISGTLQTEIDDISGSDMFKSVYDTNDNGIVDEAERVDGGSF